MEAATPLRSAHVRTAGDRVFVDGLVIADETALRLVRTREESGEDPTTVLLDAVEIGARVLDREQTGANADFVKTEFEKVSREVEGAFGERARAVSEHLERQLDEVFGPESGQLAKALSKHFSDDSSGAVQHRVRELVTEVMGQARTDLLKQFSSADGANPLADFKAASLGAIKQASDRQDANLRAMTEKMTALEVELTRLRDEKTKLAELGEAFENTAHKGRPFEESVFEAVDTLASPQGDDCDALGDTKGSTGKSGDVVVSIDACRGPARGAIVFEAKNSKLSKPEALRELDRGMAQRDADYGVLVVADEEQLPARTQALREYDGNKLFVVHDPDEAGGLALELAYRLARARVLMQRGGDEGIDGAAIHDTVERALAAMDEVRKVKSQLTGATTSIENARGIIDSMADRVRGLLNEIDALTHSSTAPGGAPEGDGALFG